MSIYTIVDTSLYKTIEVTRELLYTIIDNHKDKIDANWVNIDNLVDEVCELATKNMMLDELYYLLADHCVSKTSYHPDYNKLASYICIDRLHKLINKDIKFIAEKAYNNLDRFNNHSSLISEALYKTIINNYEKIQNKMDFNRDYLIDYFGVRTLERSYLMRIYNPNVNNKSGEKPGQIIESPQHMFMRVSLGIHGNDLESAFETYDYMSKKYFTHATPTLFNAGTKRPQMSSCFLQFMDDSIEEIFDVQKRLAYISKYAGGIGLVLSAIRSRGSIIRGTNGLSDGIIPLCGVLNKLSKYINQGGKRNGSIACYLEVYHPDIYSFCELRSNRGDEENKARDLFLALWVCDLFVKRVQENGIWSLMCPDECPGLYSTHGEEFEKLYISYEKEHRYKKQVKARDLWYHILEAQIETGMPYFLYKDHANRKSNQQNLGTIRSSNLCAEIIEYSDNTETGTCNLNSICLPAFINKDKTYNFEELIKVTRISTRNLNKVIDLNFYPTEQTKISNFKHRPIGIGVQGLADVYNIMGYPFGSDEARKLNKQIFETIYYAALSESCMLAQKYGKYSSFENSPFSKGQLQWHLWGLKQEDLLMGYDWERLIEDIKIWGTRNSLLTALMPTASTSQIMGNSEAFEPIMSNIYVRSTLAGEFIVINNNLVKDLINLNLWNEKMRKKIIAYNGSIQNISEIPENLREVYKTAFEVKQKDILIQAAERGVFVDQSQSMNLFMEESSFDVLSSCHMLSWKLGLKTAMYYLRSRPAVDPLQFGIDPEELNILLNESDAKYEEYMNKNPVKNIQAIQVLEKEEENNQENQEKPVICKRLKRGVKIEDCLMCSS
jgi:ribonucleoside-diphosphate reductase alpha chain